MRYIKPLDEARLRGMTTERLLAYQRKTMRVVATVSWDDHNKALPAGPIRSKDDPRWTELRELVRRVLGEREHVEAKEG